MKKLLTIIDQVAPVNPISIIDIGSRWGLQRPWHNYPLSRLIYYGFEADAEECQRLIEGNTIGNNIIHLPYAVFNKNDKETLYLIETGGLSSIYRPNYSCVNKYCSGGLDWKIKKEIIVETKTLHYAFEKHGVKPDFVKIDTQGAELKILEGAGEYLDSMLGLELELEFIALYENQPLFSDVDTFVRGKGFELFDLNRFWANRSTMGKFTSRRGQIIFGDVVYFRSIESFYSMRFASQAEKKDKLLKMVAIFSLYGFFDAAIEYIQDPNTPLNNYEINLVKDALNKISAYPFFQKLLFNNKFADLAGRILLVLGNGLRLKSKVFGWGADYAAANGRYLYHIKGKLNKALKK